MLRKKRGKRLIIAARNISTDMRSPGNCHGENDSGSWTSEIFRQPHVEAACVFAQFYFQLPIIEKFDSQLPFRPIIVRKKILYGQ